MKTITLQTGIRISQHAIPDNHDTADQPALPYFVRTEAAESYLGFQCDVDISPTRSQNLGAFHYKLVCRVGATPISDVFLTDLDAQHVSELFGLPLPGKKQDGKAEAPA